MTRTLLINILGAILILGVGFCIGSEYEIRHEVHCTTPVQVDTTETVGPTLDAQERSAAYVRDHHCKFVETRPAPTPWWNSTEGRMTKPGHASTQYFCSAGFSILIDDNEVQP
jgi:hypothetical protein